MPHSFYWLAVDALATYRLAILVTRDTITAPARELIRRSGYRNVVRVAGGVQQPAPSPGLRARVARSLYELVTCPWCVSIWAATATVALTAAAPRLWVYPAVVLAASGVAGFLADRTGV